MESFEQLQATIKEFIQNQEDYNSEQRSQTEKIIRALYGEKENDTIGIVVRMKNHENRLESHDKLHVKHKDFQKRLTWTSAGFLVALQLVYHGIKDFILQK